MAVLLPALAALLPASPAAAVFPGRNGKIAFASSRDGNREIYTINPDGSGLSRLTDDPATDSSPAWNLLGTKIAFTSDRDGQSDIFVMNADGSGVTQITDDGGSGPSWSPDGGRIAFARDTEDSAEVHVITLATGEVTRLTTDSCNRFPAPGVVDESCEYSRIGNHRPSWSPDGRLIAFLKNAGTSSSVYVMNADGSDQRILTEHASHANHHDWSPSGQQLAYSDHSQSIQVLKRDGSGEYVVPNTRQCPSSGSCFILQMPGWSPDGTRLVASTPSINSPAPGLYTIAPDGSDMTRILADTTLGVARPSWQASRTRLAANSTTTTSPSTTTSTTVAPSVLTGVTAAVTCPAATEPDPMVSLTITNNRSTAAEVAVQATSATGVQRFLFERILQPSGDQAVVRTELARVEDGFFTLGAGDGAGGPIETAVVPVNCVQTTTTTVAPPTTSTTLAIGPDDACAELARLWNSMESPLGMQLRQALAAALNCPAP